MTREVPYFPLYASNLIANRQYRLMTLPQRGLWISILNECWANGGVPENKSDLAKCLGVSEREIEELLGSLVMQFFKAKDGELISQELEDHRVGIYERREKQRQGGKLGAIRKKEKAGIDSGNQGQPEGQPKGSLNYIKSNQIKSNQVSNKEILSSENLSWAMDYENAPQTYKNASQGY